MASVKQLEEAKEVYDKAAEDRFRRDVESVIFFISRELSNISFGTNTSASLYSKRESLILPPFGITSIA